MHHSPQKKKVRHPAARLGRRRRNNKALIVEERSVAHHRFPPLRMMSSRCLDVRQATSPTFKGMKVGQFAAQLGSRSGHALDTFV
jgi:hypothetical protein